MIKWELEIYDIMTMDLIERHEFDSEEEAESRGEELCKGNIDKCFLTWEIDK